MQTPSGILNQPLKRSRIHICSHTVGWIALVTMIIAGSTTAAFGKQLTGYFSPLSMLFLSEVMMLVFAILSFGFFPVVKKVMKLKPALFLPLVTAGVMNGILAPLFWFWGLERTFAVNGQLFGMAETLFLIVFGTIFAHQAFRHSQGIGGLVMLLGLVVVAFEGFTQPFSIAIGDTAIIVACFFYGIGGTIIGASLRKVEPQIIIFIRSSCAVLFFFAISPFIAHPFITEIRSFPITLIAVLISYGLISRFLLIFSYYESIERLPIATVSLLSTVSVAGAVLFAHLYLGEAVLWYHVAGVALILAGTAVVQWSSLSKLEKRFVHYVKAHHRQQM